MASTSSLVVQVEVTDFAGADAVVAVVVSVEVEAEVGVKVEVGAESEVEAEVVEGTTGIGVDMTEDMLQNRTCHHYPDKANYIGPTQLGLVSQLKARSSLTAQS